MKVPRDIRARLPAGRGVNPAALGADVPESEFQRAVIARFEAAGWRVYSVPDSRRVSAAGWPDLIAAKEGERTIACELKRVGKKPRANQRWWLSRLAEAGVRVLCWTPTAADWAEVERVAGEPAARA